MQTIQSRHQQRAGAFYFLEPGTKTTEADTIDETTPQTQVTHFNKFSINDHYDYRLESHSNIYRVAIIPKHDGRVVIAQYYKNKYNANITFPFEHSGKALPNIHFRQFLEDAKPLIEAVRKTAHSQQNDYRHAFFLGGVHSVPVIYIKEKNEEGILVMDSRGQANGHSLDSLAKIIYDDGKIIPVYAVEDPRQTDGHSCYTDALLMHRDATAYNKETGKYYIPSLLHDLKSRSEKIKRNGHYSVKLPDPLLKTAQYPPFIQIHQQSKTQQTDLPATLIHKEMTLDAFRQHYSQMGSGKPPQPFSTYLRDKAIKLADIMEIQFYLNQLSDKAGDLLSEKLSAQFIKEAKIEFKRQLNEYLQKSGRTWPSCSHFSERAGLHAFAEQFYNSLLGKPDLTTPDQAAIS